MLDEYLALGGVELGNNARALAYSRCLPCCAGLLKGGACDGIHDATNAFTDAVWEWQTQFVNLIPDPRGATPAATWSLDGATATQMLDGGVEYTLTAATYRLGPEVALALSTEHTVTITIESSVNLNTTLYYRPVVGASTGQVSLGGLALVAGVPQEVTVTFTTTATATTATSGLYVVGTNGGLGNLVRMSRPIVVVGPEAAPYFDGSTIPEASDPDTNRTLWTGTVDASPSRWERNVLIAPAVSAEPPYDCSVIERAPWFDQSNEFSQVLAGFYLLSVRGITDSTMTAGVTEGIDDGGVIGAARHTTRAVRVRSMIIGCGNASAEYGLAWLKAALGTTFCDRHGDACGTSDLEFFIDCPPALDTGDPDYAATTAAYRRYLHGVACTSGPIIAEEYETPSGAYVIVVEYILTAENPFVWGETIPVNSTGDVLTAFDDIPFNLMRHPSAEVGDGIPAVTATQYAFNGSVEYGATGWSHVETGIAAGITAGASTDIAAVGPNAYRVRLLATATITDGTITAYYDVALGALPAGSKPSLSVWAAALIFAGTPTLDATLAAEVEWRTGVASLSVTPLGTIPLNGGNASATGLTIPATATIARLRVRASNIDAVSGNDLRLYADAFSLTVP
jgi:hypothetical protein